MKKKISNTQIFVGTSGWAYFWNEGTNLAWYARESLLNAVELNASFYRFPSERQILSWVEQGRDLSWCVKVHRIINHRHFLNESGRSDFARFREIFRPLDCQIAYYLFQFPPKFTVKFADRIQALLEEFDNRKIALEFRNPEWYAFDFERLRFRGAIVTPDSPEFSGTFFDRNGRIYLRFHGRRSWYAYRYSDEELREIAERIRSKHPQSVYAFFNNDHDMLSNARHFRKITEDLFGRGERSPGN